MTIENTSHNEENNLQSGDKKEPTIGPDTSGDNESFEKQTKAETVNSNLHQRDLKFIKAHRSKLRLFNPGGVYYFRHIIPKPFQTLMHILTLFISVAGLIGINYFIVDQATTEVPSIGFVSDLTLMDYISFIFKALIIIYAVNQIFKHFDDLQYIIAQLANSFNLLILIHTVLFILALSVLGISIFNLEHYNSMEDHSSISKKEEIFRFFVEVLIYKYAFLYCSKEK